MDVHAVIDRRTTAAALLVLLSLVDTVSAQDYYWWTQVFDDEGVYSGSDCASAVDCMLASREIGIQSHISRSTDGGFTWRKVWIDSGESPPLRWPLVLYDLTYADPAHAMVTADSGYILRTQDGGLTWSK